MIKTVYSTYASNNSATIISQFQWRHQLETITLHWRHNDHDGVSNHQPHGCLLSRLFGCRSKKTSKSRVTGLCAGISPGIGEFPAQMASNAENVSIWWRHHEVVNTGVSFGKSRQWSYPFIRYASFKASGLCGRSSGDFMASNSAKMI